MNKRFKLIAAALAVVTQLSFAAAADAALPSSDAVIPLLSQAKDAPGISELEAQRRLERENQRYEEALKRRPNESDDDWKIRKKAEKQRHDKIVNDIKQTAKGKK